VTEVTTQTVAPSAGALIRRWRERRKLSQLALSSVAAVSSRHLSFIETGRARPSREMVLHLAHQLEVPLREQNRMLLAAGYAPIYPDGGLEGPDSQPVRQALDRFLAAHEPYPAVVVDRHWNLVAANRGLAVLTGRVSPALMDPPVNALRVALHPDGMAPDIVNLDEWSHHLLHRLSRQVNLTGDEGLAELYDELVGYPGVVVTDPHDALETPSPILQALQLRTDRGDLSLFTTVTVFGTTLDVTLAELAIEAFYPADGLTAGRLAATG
jgi:transcriptional regulator with XRE-family HTH domain